eukprot:3179116-Rhodomonas_salina.2
MEVVPSRPPHSRSRTLRTPSGAARGWISQPQALTSVPGTSTAYALSAAPFCPAWHGIIACVSTGHGVGVRRPICGRYSSGVALVPEMA